MSASERKALISPRRALKGLVGLWDAFWFRPESAANLAGCRVVIALTMLHYLWCRNPWDPTSTLNAVAYLPAELWMPRRVIALFGLGPPSLATVQTCWVIAISATAATLLGLSTRLATALLLPTGLYLLAIPNCWGKVNHGGNVLGMCLLILPLVPAGCLWSLDSLRRARARIPIPERSAHYNWPVKLFQLSFALMLTFASLNKLQKSGLDWVTSPNLRNLILSHHFARPDPDPGALAVWVASEAWRWQTAAAAALTTQLLFVLFVFVKSAWLRAIGFTFALGFVLGLDLLMKLPNPMLLILLGLFIPWGAIREQLLRICPTKTAIESRECA